jgi:putative Holliday junction resolvase
MICKNIQELSNNIKANNPIIAIDYGFKKIGIAISNNIRTFAMPLEIILNDKNNAKIAKSRIQKIIDQYLIGAIIIGLPINMNGTFSEQTEIVQKFAQNLSVEFQLPIFLQDERMTSKEANNLLKSFGIKRKLRNQNDDMVAATIILESVLESLKKIYIHSS